MTTTAHHTHLMDEAFKAFEQYRDTCTPFLAESLSELDTRAKYLDPLLTTVLGYDEASDIRREKLARDTAGNGFVDYLIRPLHPTLVIEAKSSETDFELPDSGGTLLKLDGTIITKAILWETILQARRYCEQHGARFAVVTNGKQYVLFKALCERQPWQQGYALVFRSLDAIRDRFEEFWTCLSKRTINFEHLVRLTQKHHADLTSIRPLDRLPVPERGQRNQFAFQMQRWFGPVLLDQAAFTPKFLEQCYCTSADILKYGDQFRAVVDPLPEFMSPIKEARPGHKKDEFARTMATIDAAPGSPALVVLMGGIGVGKTMFLHWLLSVYLPGSSRESWVAPILDFLAIDFDEKDAFSTTVRHVIEGIESEATGYFDTLDQLREVFGPEIRRVRDTYLAPWESDRVELDRRIADFIKEQSNHSEAHLRAICRYLKNKCQKRVVIVLDNIDQKPPAIQERLFQAARSLASMTGAVVVISIRESTYLRIARTEVGMAFSPVVFHLRSQPVGLVLQKRLDYLRHLLLDTDSLATSDVTGVDSAIRLVQSLLADTDDARQSMDFLQELGAGNIRKSFQLLFQFLVSGQTQMELYLHEVELGQRRAVPFHEFCHSAILGDYRIFDGNQTQSVINLFQLARTPGPSHFVALQILGWFARQGLGSDVSPIDYCMRADLELEFAGYGVTGEELAFVWRHLWQDGALVGEIGISDDLLPPSRLALTRRGSYYLRSLYRDFTYYSLMAIDTAIQSEPVVGEVVEAIRNCRGGSKIPLQTRLGIARTFVDYLRQQAAHESNRWQSAPLSVTRIVTEMDHSLSAVEQRVKHATGLTPQAP